MGEMSESFLALDPLANIRYTFGGRRLSQIRGTEKIIRTDSGKI